jgi:hypothetical protein
MLSPYSYEEPVIPVKSSSPWWIPKESVTWPAAASGFQK